MTITPYVPGTFAASGLPTGIWSGVNGYAVLPYLIGQTPEVNKAPLWSTRIARSTSGRERRSALWPYPLWQFELKYEVIRNKATLPELTTMWEFFNVAQGQAGTWLFVDPSDNLITTPYAFGSGNGVQTQFTLTRPLNSFSEPVFGVYGQTVYINGTSTSAYTLSSNGVITFTTPPAGGAALTWSGYFYFGCRFLQDDLTFKQMVLALWSGDSLKFTSVRV